MIGGNDGHYIKDLYESSGLSSILCRQEELKYFYASGENYQFRMELFDIMQVWVSLLLQYVKKAQVDSKKEPIKQPPASRLGMPPNSRLGGGAERRSS